jgi:hypothetical protein
MVNPVSLRKDVEEILRNGTQVRIRYFDFSYGAGSYYDDDLTLSQSGTDFYTSGLIFPINSKQGSSEALLVEQGRLLDSDSKLYVVGTVETSGLFKIGIGSPQTSTSPQFAMIPEGINTYKINGSPVYNSIYLRQLTNGSLAEE